MKRRAIAQLSCRDKELHLILPFATLYLLVMVYLSLDQCHPQVQSI